MSAYDGFVLVKYNDNYADEFDISGGALMPFTDYSEWFFWFSETHRLIAQGAVYEFYFGTNEFIDYDDALQWVKCFEIRGVDDAGAAYLREFVADYAMATHKRTHGWGQFPDTDELKRFVLSHRSEEANNETKV